MNQEYTYIEGKAIVKTDKGVKEPIEYYDNLNEALVQENLIETMENNILSLEKALEIALTNQEERFNYLTKLGTKIKTKLKEYKNVSINSRENSLPSVINFSLLGLKALDIEHYFEQYDIYLSTKTSCCPITTPSKLVYALTKDKQKATSSVRVSLSYKTTEAEIDEFLRVFDLLYKEYENGKV